MEEMVHVYFFGKQYQVPKALTIMRAMEYAGYQLVRGCGCRNGFCGACATLYRVKGRQELKTCLACQTQVEEGMYVATLPFFPLVKQVYDMDKIPLNQQVMMQLYPEICACIGCNACTKSCTQELNVMQYIAYAQRGDFSACAEESFDCVMCGVCSARCPAGISHPQVAMLARRINGKYLMPRSQHLEDRVGEIADGTFRELMESLMGKLGLQLHQYANGLDQEPVRSKEQREPVKSVGNGTTFSKNLTTVEQVHGGIAMLADSVAMRLRHAGLYACGVQLTVRDPEFHDHSRQMQLAVPTRLIRDLAEASISLLHGLWKPPAPVRMLTVTAIHLIPAEDAYEQVDLFTAGSIPRKERQEKLESAMDRIRGKYGADAITFGTIPLEKEEDPLP